MPGLGVRAAKLRGGVLVGVLVGALAALAAWTRPAILERGEFWTYDLRARAAARAGDASKDIVLIDVAERDIRDVERNFDVSFPWPRVLYGYLTRYVGSGGPRAIVYDWFFQGRGSLGVGDAAEFAAAMKEVGRTVIGVYVSSARHEADTLAGNWGVEVGSFPDRAAAREAALAILSFDRHAFIHGNRLLLGGEASAAEAAESYQKLAGTEEMKAILTAPATPRALAPAEIAGQVTDESLVAELAGVDLAVPPDLALGEE